MLKKLSSDQHKQPFKGPITITRVQTGKILEGQTEDLAFGPLAFIDHAVMKKGITIKMHEHVNDEILSYVWKGTMYHRDSAGHEVPVTPGNLMMMNAGSSFWHEEKVKQDHVEMLQIFIRPEETDLESAIQFHDKPVGNRDWFLMVGPKDSLAPIHVRQQVYIYDVHPKCNDELNVPVREGFQPFLYVLDGEIVVGDHTIRKMEAITDTTNKLPKVYVKKDSTLVLFFVDLDASMSMMGTISGMK